MVYSCRSINALDGVVWLKAGHTSVIVDLSSLVILVIGKRVMLGPEYLKAKVDRRLAASDDMLSVGATLREQDPNPYLN